MFLDGILNFFVLSGAAPIWEAGPSTSATMVSVRTMPADLRNNRISKSLLSPMRRATCLKCRQL